jgi:hypothetical protein
MLSSTWRGDSFIYFFVSFLFILSPSFSFFPSASPISLIHLFIYSSSNILFDLIIIFLSVPSSFSTLLNPLTILASYPGWCSVTPTGFPLAMYCLFAGNVQLSFFKYNTYTRFQLTTYCFFAGKVLPSLFECFPTDFLLPTYCFFACNILY